MSQEPSAERELKKFLASVREAGKVWASVLVRLVAVRIESGDWVSLSTLCMLEPRGVMSRPRVKRPAPVRAGQHVVALQERIRVDQLEAFVRGVIGGKQTVAGVQVTFVSGIRGEPPVMRRLGEDFGSSQEGTQVSSTLLQPPLVNAHLYGISGDRSRDVLNRVPGGEAAVDAELRRSSPVRNGIAHLIEGARASLSGWTPDNAVKFEVIAPLGVVLDEACELRRGVLRLMMVAVSEVVGKLATVRIGGEDEKGNPIDERAKAPRGGWRMSEGCVVAEWEHEVPAARKLILLLQLGDQTIQKMEREWRGGAPGGLASAYVLHVPAQYTAWRRYLLEAEGSDANEFANAVARLFGMLGVGVLQLSDKKGSDHVDILAAVGRELILAVECTTSTFGTGKMEKLIRRTAELKAQMTEREVRARAVGVMVSSMPQEQLSKQACREAAADGIVVLARQDLAELGRTAEMDVHGATALRELIASRQAFPLHHEGRLAELIHAGRSR